MNLVAAHPTHTHNSRNIVESVFYDGGDGGDGDGIPVTRVSNRYAEVQV